MVVLVVTLQVRVLGQISAAMALRLSSLLRTGRLPGSLHRLLSLTVPAGQSAAQAVSFLYTPEHQAIRESLRKVRLLLRALGLIQTGAESHPPR